MKLYQIGQVYNDFLNETNFDDLTPEQIQSMLGAIEGEFADKADNIITYIKSLRYESEAIKQEVKNLQDRAKAKEKKADKLQEYLYSTLKSMKLKEFETTKHHIKIKNNPPKLNIKDEAKLLLHLELLGKKAFIIESKSIDKTNLKKAIQKEGLEVEYAEIISTDRLEVK